MARITAILMLAALLAFPASSFAVTPWGAVYEVARDERSLSDITADKNITTGIKTTLVNKDGKLGLAVKPYCFLGRVTLLGQLSDEGFKSFAVATAKKTKGVKSVTTYWEAPGKEGTATADLEIAAKLRTTLVGDKELSSTQVETEVFGGKVYLLGMVRTQKDADRAMGHARATKGVTGVTSLLIVSKKK